MQKTVSVGPLVLENRVFLAPMAGISNLPMRLMAREFGASLTFTEMVSVNGLTREGRKSYELLKSVPGDRPVGIQLFGDDAGTLAEAARLVESYGDLIDINMGCPVRKVVGTGAGSALLREPAKVSGIIRAVRAATALPFTVKIRTGWVQGEESFLEIGKIAQEEGCDAVTLHPRSRAQMFDGKADWSCIAQLKEALHIPVIGSGDLFAAADALRMFQETGCDAVMIARGAMGNPWIFREALSLLRGEEPLAPSRLERFSAASRHFELFSAEVGDRVAVMEMRKHLSWYSKGLPGAAHFRAEVNGVENRDQLITLMGEFFHG